VCRARAIRATVLVLGDRGRSPHNQANRANRTHSYTGRRASKIICLPASSPQLDKTVVTQLTLARSTCHQPLMLSPQRTPPHSVPCCDVQGSQHTPRAESVPCCGVQGSRTRLFVNHIVQRHIRAVLAAAQRIVLSHVQEEDERLKLATTGHCKHSVSYQKGHATLKAARTLPPIRG